MLLSNFLRIDATLISLQRTQREKKGSITTSHNHNLAAAPPLKANLLMMEKARDVRCLRADRKQERQSVVICCLSHCLSICSRLAFLLVTLSRFFFFCFSASGEMTPRSYFLSYFGFLHECVVLAWVAVEHWQG